MLAIWLLSLLGGFDHIENRLCDPHTGGGVGKRQPFAADEVVEGHGEVIPIIDSYKTGVKAVVSKGRSGILGLPWLTDIVFCPNDEN